MDLCKLVQEAFPEWDDKYEDIYLAQTVKRELNQDGIFGMVNCPKSYVEALDYISEMFIEAGVIDDSFTECEYDEAGFLLLLEIVLSRWVLEVEDVDIETISTGMQYIMLNHLGLDEESKELVNSIKTVECNNPRDLLGVTKTWFSSTDNSSEGNGSNDIEAEIEKMRRFWVNKVNEGVKDILTSYEQLYRSGYGLTMPAGILTSTGIKKSTTKGEVKWYGKEADLAEDIAIYKKINEIFDNLFDSSKLIASQDNTIIYPSISQLGDTSYKTYIDLHIGFLFGHLNFCKGDNGIRKFFTKEGIDNPSQTKVTKYSDMEKWIRYTLERIFYLNYIEAGIKADSAEDVFKYGELAEKVNGVLKRCLKHVMVVTEKAKGSNTKVRVCCDIQKDIERLRTQLNSKLNTGSSDSIKVEANYYGAGVYEFNIITNYNGYKNNTLYAHQVLNVLEEQGIRPSWSNAIIGKDTNGNIAQYDFRNRQAGIVTIYGSMGSGKGVMTLSLLAAALGDNCDIMYIDGKPDSSKPIAELAWKSNVDAVVFNGRDDKMHLESDPLCKRGKDEFDNISSIPDGIFSSDEQAKQFLTLNNYLRGIDLYIRYCKARAKNAGVDGAVSKDNWLVAVFDECQAMSSIEMRFNDYLYEGKDNILKSIETEKEEVDGKMKVINYRQDARWQFITNYRKWKKGLIDSLKGDLLTITIRQADTSAIFIWQTTAFPDNSRGTVLGEFLAAAAGQSIKFIGTGANVKNGNTVYGTPNSLKDSGWYSKFTDAPKGTWAVGKNTQESSSDIKGEGMTLFKPFNVYSDTNGKNLIIDNARNAGLSPQDLIGVSLTENLEVIPEVGFEGYVTRLLGTFNINPADVLNRSFVTIDNFIRSSGASTSLIDFIYSFDKSIVEGESEGVPIEGGVGVSFEGEAQKEDYSAGNTESFGDEGTDMSDFSSGYDEDDFDEGEKMTAEEQQAYNRNYSDTQAKPDTPVQPIYQPQASQVIMNGEPVQTVDMKEPLRGLENQSWVDSEGRVDMSTALKGVTEALIQEIDRQFGGFDRITSVTVKDCNLYMNNVRICPQVENVFVESLPLDVRTQVSQGRWANIFVYGYLQEFENLSEISIDTYDFFLGKFIMDYGINRRKFHPIFLFKVHRNLCRLTIAGQTITYEDIKSGNVDWDSDGIRKVNQSKDIQQAMHKVCPNERNFSLSEWYNSPATQKGLKRAKGIFGVTAIGALALATPVGAAIAVGAIAHKKASDFGLGSRIKKGLSSFAEAFKESL